jgi:acetyl-CoA C-acetyltransferase
MADEQDRSPVILSAVRTPIGRFQGSLSGIPAPRLGAVAIKAALERAGVDDSTGIDEILMGNVVTAGEGQAPARQAGIFAGVPSSVGATTINKVCGSGLKTVILAAQAIRAGDAELIVAGGMECMSKAPYLVDGRGGALRFGHAQLTDSVLHDGLWDPFENWAMGDAGEFIADQFNVTRESMDEFALRSHQKAIDAIDQGKFKYEIVPVEIHGRKGEVTVFEIDECPRRDASLETLAKLKPAFRKDGRITPGNAPGLNDGAAAVVVASRWWAQSMGAKPLARVRGYAQSAVEPKYLFDAPARAIPRLLDKVGWTLAEVDLIELNEAFAAQTLANGYSMANLGWDWDKVNVNGGSIALGHPIGASGARILTTLIFALKDRRLRRGIAALCLGGAEAVAIAIEIEPE